MWLKPSTLLTLKFDSKIAHLRMHWVSANPLNSGLSPQLHLFFMTSHHKNGGNHFQHYHFNPKLGPNQGEILKQQNVTLKAKKRVFEHFKVIHTCKVMANWAKLMTCGVESYNSMLLLNLLYFAYLLLLLITLSFFLWPGPITWESSFTPPSPFHTDTFP